MSEKRYTLEVDSRQLAVIEHACEIVARLGIGQVRDALYELQEREEVPPGLRHEAFDEIEQLAKSVCHYGRGITHSDVSPNTRIAWDIYAVIRHKRSWERAVEAGHVESEESPRNWAEMMGVNYDEPFHHERAVPLAKIEQKEKP